MEFNEFQKWVKDFYEQRHWSDYGPFIRLGFLTEEVGEVSRAVRAIEIGRDRPNEPERVRNELEQELIEELGDVLGNLILLANMYEVSMEQVAEAHKDKLLKRYGKEE